MCNAPQEEDRYAYIEGVKYRILGPNCTRTATHLLYGGSAIPLRRREDNAGLDGSQ